MNRSLSTQDRARLDQYLTSGRELEQRLHSAEAWAHKPIPVVSAKPPEDIGDSMWFVKKTEQLFGLSKLALSLNRPPARAFCPTLSQVGTGLEHGFDRATGLKAERPCIPSWIHRVPWAHAEKKRGGPQTSRTSRREWQTFHIECGFQRNERVASPDHPPFPCSLKGCSQGAVDAGSTSTASGTVRVLAAQCRR
jgi:hypothetical protein